MREVIRERHYTGFWRQGAIMQILPLLPLLVLVTACNDSSNQQSSAGSATTPTSQVDDLSLSKIIGSISNRVQGASGGVQEALGPQGQVIQEKTKDEMEKLFRWEYRVVDYPTPLAADAFQQNLMDLGNEGWECFNITSSPSSTRVTCKRRPRSALAYLKLIPGL